MENFEFTRAKKTKKMTPNLVSQAYHAQWALKFCG